MANIGQLSYFLLPVILGGVCNMIFIKLPVADRLKAAMDYGRFWVDGKRVLGDNKTWKGFLGMIFITALWMAVFGQLNSHFDWARALSILDSSRFDFPLAYWIYGGLWGFGYVLFELPNSFIKRRINIGPGENHPGPIGLFFLFMDQADSVIGCMILMLFFYTPTLQEAAIIFVLGTVIHYVINILLYLVGLKNQIG